MSIATNAPIALPSTPEQISPGLVLASRLTPKGVAQSLQLSFQHYRAAADGTGPIKVGDPVQVSVPDVAARAAKDPVFAAFYNQLQDLLSSYVAQSKF